MLPAARLGAALLTIRPWGPRAPRNARGQARLHNLRRPLATNMTETSRSGNPLEGSESPMEESAEGAAIVGPAGGQERGGPPGLNLRFAGTRAADAKVRPPRPIP